MRRERGGGGGRGGRAAAGWGGSAGPRSAAAAELGVSVTLSTQAVANVTLAGSGGNDPPHDRHRRRIALLSSIACAPRWLPPLDAAVHACSAGRPAADRRKGRAPKQPGATGPDTSGSRRAPGAVTLPAPGACALPSGGRFSRAT